MTPFFISDMRRPEIGVCINSNHLGNSVSSNSKHTLNTLAQSAGQTQTQSLSQNLVYVPAINSAEKIVDDVINTEGKVHPHWQYLLESLETMGVEAFEDRQKKALRILRDDGATYNIYSDPLTPNRTWSLDLVPSIISSEQWASIEAGLLERSELFNLILKDLYGPRDLIRCGVIPPEALFLHEGFLRACDGVQMPGEHALIMHAVDMMRTRDGEVRILTDRTQSPSGAGYALENRTVMSRVLPSLFRDSHVHRLAGFFQRLRNTLNQLSPNQDQARIVLLTPGAHNETYFEHAYIANYLGLHLVQSGDLVVRNGFVWMKSLDGLSRVDVILRRVDDSFCDPVELRGDSQLGVAGLLEVARAGRVVIANPLGSGVLENPVFLKYLPQIAKHFLGRELRLNSVDNYWLGDRKDKSYVENNLDSLVIKPIFRGSNQRSIYAAELSKESRKELLLKIQQKPEKFVAQPILDTAHVPTFNEGKLVPRPAILRSFCVAADSSYSVMPGGLTRIGIEESSFLISNQAGAKSKDTWVIASEPERVASSSSSADDTPVSDADLISLPSRVVENLYWMGRYSERAEASLRILRTVFVLLNGEEPITENCRRILLQTVTEITATRPGFIQATDEMINNPEQELIDIVRNGSRMGSIRSNLNAITNCADETKELLSSDTLRVINDIRDALSGLDEALNVGLNSAPEEALDPLVSALMALSGLSQESMVRDFGWRFMEIGRRIERASLTAVATRNLLVPEVGPAEQAVLTEALLLSLESLISYRRRYRARMGVQTSLDLIMMDTSNPRSLLYQIEKLNEHVGALPKSNESRHELTPKEKILLECETVIKLPSLTGFCMRENGKRVKLNSNMTRIQELLSDLSNVITDKYFDHRETSQQLVRRTWGAM